MDQGILIVQKMWDMARQSAVCQDLHLECAKVLDQQEPEIWCATCQCQVRAGPDAWLDYAGSFADMLCGELQAHCEKMVTGDPHLLKGNIDKLTGGNATMQITDFLLALKTVDRFAAINRSTLLQVPSFPHRLQLDKRMADYATHLVKWRTQLQTLQHAFDQHMRCVYAGTILVLPSDDKNLRHLGLEGRDVMLLMDYQRHTLQEHWMGVASLVDGVAIFMWSLLLHKGAMTETYMSRLYQLMEESGLQGAVSGVLGAGRLKRRLADWKAAFGAAMFMSPLIIFCGEGLGQVGTMMGAIRAGSRIEAMGKPLMVRLVERVAWKYIIGVAAGMWDAEFGLAEFLDTISSTIASWQAQTDENFFEVALDDARLYKLEWKYNVSESNKRWLRDTLLAWRQEGPLERPDSWSILKRQHRRLVDSVDRHSWNQLFVVPMEEDPSEKETGMEDQNEDLTIREAGPGESTAGCRARGRHASVVFPIVEEEIQLERSVLSPPMKMTKTIGGEHEHDGEHELDVGDTLSFDDMLALDLELPGGTSSISGFLDGFSPNDVGTDITGEDLVQEFEGSGDAAGAEMEEDSSSFALKLSRSEHQHHIKLLEEDSNLEKKWHLTLLQSQPWFDTDSATRRAKRAREESSSTPACKATKLDPKHYERAQEPLVFPGCYLPSLDKELTLQVYGLQSTLEDDQKTIAGYLACIAAGAEHVESADPADSYATPMVAKMNVEELMSNTGRLQTLLRSQHVYVTGVRANSEWNWDLECMKRVGNIDVVQEVQDHSRRSEPKGKLHVDCSLRTVLQQGNLNGKGLVLNALFLPIPEKPLEEPQCIEEVMCQSTAFNQTREMPEDIFECYYPKLATMFALASTAATFSYVHADGMGVGTVVQVLTGKKIWFLFRRCGVTMLNGYIGEFFDDWQPGFIPDCDRWDAEIFMRPNTHHAVITLENCIVSGQHFYVTSCIEDMVVGFVHMHMWDFFITNVIHHELRPLLLQMMCYFSQVICGPGGRQSSDVHCPDITTRRGLLDVVALGNLCAFTTALNGKNEEEHKDGVLLAINCYKNIIRFASRDLVLYFPKGKLRVTPYQLAQESAKHFAAAIIVYLQRVADTQSQSVEGVDDPLDLETFQTGVLTVLKELFNVGLPQKEIDALATQPHVRLLWRCPFIVQRKGKVFNQQLWDEQWEAMITEATQANIWTFDSIGSRPRAELLDSIGHHYIKITPVLFDNVYAYRT
ncbi:hypothetical protein F5146DRAFT_1135527 [Armillaria mellea]|nr:hypothetical protein F5146DRAFT_1135527 [Armillaria mellea]